MRLHSEAVKADMRRRMSPPHRQSVAQISAELGIHVVTLLGELEGHLQNKQETSLQVGSAGRNWPWILLRS
jgi:hypothetical protein